MVFEFPIPTNILNLTWIMKVNHLNLNYYIDYTGPSFTLNGDGYITGREITDKDWRNLIKIDYTLKKDLNRKKINLEFNDSKLYLDYCSLRYTDKLNKDERFLIAKTIKTDIVPQIRSLLFTNISEKLKIELE